MDNGVINGKATKFDEFGNIIQECNYVSGKLDGDYKEYHSVDCVNKEPKLKMKGQYSDGSKVGEWVRYDRDGNIEERVDYDPDEGAGLLEYTDIALYADPDTGEIKTSNKKIEFCDLAFAEQDI